MTLITFSHVSKAKNFLVFEKHVKQEMQPLLISSYHVYITFICEERSYLLVLLSTCRRDQLKNLHVHVPL